MCVCVCVWYALDTGKVEHACRPIRIPTVVALRLIAEELRGNRIAVGGNAVDMRIMLIRQSYTAVYRINPHGRDRLGRHARDKPGQKQKEKKVNVTRSLSLVH